MKKTKDTLKAEILIHIFNVLGVIPSKKTILNNCRGIIHKDYLLESKISEQLEDHVANYNVWGANLNIDDNLSILICPMSLDYLELNVIIAFNDINYFLSYRDYEDDEILECDIKYMVEGKIADANVLIQANLLSGIERVLAISPSVRQLDNTKLVEVFYDFIKVIENE